MYKRQGYGRMIRKAEHMSNPKNATLRQIKMKYDSIKEINGHVANPMIFTARSLNKCKLGIFSLNKLNNLSLIHIYVYKRQY